MTHLSYLFFLLLFSLVFYFLVKMVKVVSLSPEERQKIINELKTKQAELKTCAHKEEANQRIAIRHGEHISHDKTQGSRKSSLANSSKPDDTKHSLTTMWTGDTKPVEFTYADENGGKTRRTVKVDKVTFNSKGFFYLTGVCFERKESYTFKVDSITTKLKVGSNRYDFEEWCVYMLDILPSEAFPKTYFERDS